MLPLLGGQLAGVLEQLHEGHQVVAIGDRHLRPGGLQDPIDQTEHPRPVLLRNPDDVTDHRDRQSGRQIDEFTTAAAQQRACHRMGPPSDPVFQLGHRARCECAGDDSAADGVIGRVQTHDGRIHVEQRHVLDQRAASRRERLVVAMHACDVGVLGTHPELAAHRGFDVIGELLVKNRGTGP
jgi:hypothetical protein